MSRALVNQALVHAVRLHQAGDLAGAEAVYRQVLQVEPENPDATHLLGMIAHARGNPHEAVELIGRAVERSPGSAHFHANLGNALRDAGRPSEAAAAYGRALELQPASPEVLNNLGIVHLQLGDDSAAAWCFERSLEQRPGHAGALCNLSSALSHLGRHEEAVRAAGAAAAAAPELAAAYAALGSAHATAGDAEEARDAFSRAVALDANLVEAHVGLSGVLSWLQEHRAAVGAAGYATKLRPQDHAAWMALGVALLGDQRREEAVEAFKQAAALLPGFAPAYANMGVVLSELGRHGEALEALRQAAALSPQDPSSLRNLALALDAIGDRGASEDAARRALALRPEDPASLDLLGSLLGRRGEAEESAALLGRASEMAPEDDRIRGRLGASLERVERYEEAIREFERAVETSAEPSVHRLRLGMARLRRGDFARGWADLEARFDSAEYQKSHPAYNRPRWRASTARGGETVLVTAEQGFGDAIQFVRFAAVLRRRCARVIVQARPEVAALLAGASGVDQVILFGEAPPEFDAWIPAMSLALELGARLGAIPAEIPYLRPDSIAAAAWRRNLEAEGPGLRVGLVWAGNPGHELDFSRTIPAETIMPLAATPGVRWFSLQKGRGAAETARLRAAGWEIRDLAPLLTDFSETAAAMASLDLVVTVDTSAAHLAGALGRPVWIMLHAVPEWRWLLGREDSPWYPTARLLRQAKRGDWAGVIERVRRELFEKTAGLPRGTPGPS